MDQQHPLALQILTAAVVVSGIALLCLVAAAISLARAVLSFRGDAARLSHDAALLAEHIRAVATETKPHLATIRAGLETIAHRSDRIVSVVRAFSFDAIRSVGRLQAGFAAPAASVRLYLGPTLQVGRMAWRLHKRRPLD